MKNQSIETRTDKHARISRLNTKTIIITGLCRFKK